MNFLCKKITCILIVILITNALTANEKVSHQNNFTELRDGEFLIDTCVTYIPVGGELPSIAFDGTSYLVVWSNSNIYATRVSQSGAILDSARIVVSDVPIIQNSPSVAFNGTNYLVVWEDKRSGPSTDIYGARIDTSGIILDPVGIAISTAPNGQTNPSVGSDGIDYLVAWQSSSDIYGARVSQTGAILDPDGFVISAGINSEESPSVTFGGTNYLVAWQDYRNGTWDIYGTRVSQSGTVLDSSGIAISATVGNKQNPSISSDGIDYFVTWWWGDIYGARVTQSGIVLDTLGIVISSVPGPQRWPTVSFDGINYFVAWNTIDNGYDVYGARVDTSGVVLDTAGVPISTAVGSQLWPAIIGGNTNCLVVWEDNRYVSPSYIYGARVSQSGSVLDTSGILLSTKANSQYFSDVASDGTDYLVVWRDDRKDELGYSCSNIYGARVAQSGTVLDPEAIVISDNTQFQSSPSVSCDGTNYLVVWFEDHAGSYSDIYGARITQSGVVLDTLGIAISTEVVDQWMPSVCFNGANYLVAWQDFRNGTWDIYGARISQSGNALDTLGIPISTAIVGQFGPSVASISPDFLVVWLDYRSGSYWDVYGARVDQSGVVLDTSGILIAQSVCYSSLGLWSVSVASDGVNYFVVWPDDRNGTPDIYGARVDQSGVVLDPSGIAISTAPDSQYWPSVDFDGTNYIVVWNDKRSGDYYDIYGAKINTSGDVIDTFAVSLQPGNQYIPEIAHSQGDTMLITYYGWTNSINGQPVNNYHIWGKQYPFVGIEENVGLSVKEASLGLKVHPNPFCNSVEISWNAEHSAEGLELKIYDVTGRVVKQIPAPTAYSLLPPSFSWDGTDDLNRKLPQGVYIIKLNVGSYSDTKKVVFLK